MANYILGTLAGLYYPGASATLSGSLAGLEGSLEGGQKHNELSGDLAGLEGELTGYSDRFGRLVGELAGLDGEITAISGRVASISGTLAGLTGSLTGTPHKIAFLSGTLAGLEGRMTGSIVSSGAISGVLAGLTGSIISLGTFHIISVNPALRGVTEYTNYSFDSFFEFGGNYYGVNATGIYLLSGSTDAGTAISAYFDSGDVEYAKGQRSKITDAHALGRTSGSIRLTLYEDDGTGNTYSSIGDTTGKQQNYRFKPAKGAEGVKWRYRMANVAGGTMEIQQLNLLVAEMSRKR